MEEQLGLANRLSLILLSHRDLDRIGRDFVLELRELLRLDWGAITLIEEASGQVRLLPLSHKLTYEWELGEKISLKDTPVEWVANEKRALVEPDIGRASRFWTGSYLLKKGVRTVAYMPLFKEGNVFGAVIFASKHPQSYQERELRLLKYATTQITLPVQHFVWAQETEERIKLAHLHLAEEERQELVAALIRGVSDEMQKIFPPSSRNAII